MKNKTFQKILALFLLALFLVPAWVSAHQPRITESRLTQVPDPEISNSDFNTLEQSVLHKAFNI